MSPRSSLCTFNPVLTPLSVLFISYFKYVYFSFISLLRIFSSLLKSLLPSTFSCPDSFVFIIFFSFLHSPSPTRGPHPRPEEPGFQCDTVPDAKGGTGADKAEAVSQCCPLHLGDGWGQVHATVLPYRLLALLREAQWRLVMGTETIICDFTLLFKIVMVVQILCNLCVNVTAINLKRKMAKYSLFFIFQQSTVCQQSFGNNFFFFYICLSYKIFFILHLYIISVV